MNTIEIEMLLSATCKYDCQGVYSNDTLPPKPKLLVRNTDPSTKPELHWISIYVSKDGCGEYYDSFGRLPTKHFVDYLNEHCRNWIYNKKQLQSIISTFCGYYCCVYCIYRSLGFDLFKIKNLLSTDTAFNDSIVHGFICNKS